VKREEGRERGKKIEGRDPLPSGTSHNIFSVCEPPPLRYGALDGTGRSVCVKEKTTRNDWHFPEEIGGQNDQIQGEMAEN
jgi:hypothetical protein